jgi:hypothetical protein
MIPLIMFFVIFGLFVTYLIGLFLNDLTTQPGYLSSTDKTGLNNPISSFNATGLNETCNSLDIGCNTGKIYALSQINSDYALLNYLLFIPFAVAIGLFVILIIRGISG